MQANLSDNDFQYQLKNFLKIQFTIYERLNLMYNITIIKDKEKQKQKILKNKSKIQITIYK